MVLFGIVWFGLIWAETIRGGRGVHIVGVAVACALVSLRRPRFGLVLVGCGGHMVWFGLGLFDLGLVGLCMVGIFSPKEVGVVGIVVGGSC